MKKLKAIGVLFASLVLTMMFTSLVSAAPAGLKQTKATQSSFRVEWDTTGTSTYYVAVSYDGGVTYNAPEKTSSPYKEIYNLNAGATYYVKVSADGVDYCAPIDVVTIPTSVSSSTLKQTNATTTTGTFTWGAVSGATGYDFYVSPDNNYSNLAYAKTVNTNSATANLSANNVVVAVKAFRKSSSGYKAVSSTVNAYSHSNKLIPGKSKKPTTNKSVYSNGYYPGGKRINIACPYSYGEYDGWQVQYCKYNGKGKKTVSSLSSNFANIPVNTNMFYKVRTRAYVNINGSKKYGAWSAYNIICQDQTYGSSYQNKSTVGSNKVKITWKKVKGAKNYTVYMSTSKTSGFKKITTTKKRYVTVSKFKKKSLKKGTYYYYYIVANRKVGKKTYKSGKEYVRYIYFY